MLYEKRRQIEEKLEQAHERRENEIQSFVNKAKMAIRMRLFFFENGNSATGFSVHNALGEWSQQSRDGGVGRRANG